MRMNGLNIKDKLRSFTFFIILISVLFYASEAVTFHGFSTKYLHVNPESFVVLAILFLFYLRIHDKNPDIWTNIFIISAPISLYFSFLLIFLDQINSANFIFSTIHVHPALSIKVGLILSLYTLIALGHSYIKRKSSFILLVLPFWLLALALTFRSFFPSSYFQHFVIEDSAIEYITMFVYLLTAFYCVKSLKIIIGSQHLSSYIKYLYSLIFIIIIIGSLWVAGEEISWGQRILGYETPNAVALQNKQGEFNFHNFEPFMKYLYQIYALIALYGASAWLLAKLLSKILHNSKISKLFLFFSPPVFLISFFIHMLFFAATRLELIFPQLRNQFNYIEETMELFLSIGIVLFIYFNFKKLTINIKFLKSLLQ